MRCDQCKHWGSDKSEYAWEASEVGFKLCDGVRERWRIQDAVAEKSKTWEGDDATTDKFIDARKEGLKAARAYVEDGSEYKAILWTAPDFFCALFVPNEVP